MNAYILLSYLSLQSKASNGNGTIRFQVRISQINEINQGNLPQTTYSKSTCCRQYYIKIHFPGGSRLHQVVKLIMKTSNIFNNFKLVRQTYKSDYTIKKMGLNTRRENLTCVKSFLLLAEFVVFHLSILFCLK